MSNPHETPPRDLLKRGVALGVPLVVSGSAPGRESRPSPGGRIAMGAIGAAAACVAALSIGGAGGLRAEEARGFRFRDVSARSLAIDEGERPVLVYNHGTMSKDGVPSSYDRASYVHPLHGLDGAVLTDDFPKDHFHHRGLFWAWPHVEIDGKQYESWVPATLKIAFEFIHPSHPDFPPTWLTRHYGCLCVGWPGVAGGKLEPGVPVRCAYRVWIHSGEATVADLERAWREYAAEAARPAPGPEAPPASDEVSGGGPSRG